MSHVQLGGQVFIDLVREEGGRGRERKRERERERKKEREREREANYDFHLVHNATTSLQRRDVD